MEQVCLDEKTFDHLEQDMLKAGTKLMKDLFATFKFKLLLDIHITPELQQKTARGLKEYREANWDKSLSRNEAYKKYMQD